MRFSKELDTEQSFLYTVPIKHSKDRPGPMMFQLCQSNSAVSALLNLDAATLTLARSLARHPGDTPSALADGVAPLELVIIAHGHPSTLRFCKGVRGKVG
eukprot:g25799.t1